jgi:hypothetical protein
MKKRPGIRILLTGMLTAAIVGGPAVSTAGAGTCDSYDVAAPTLNLQLTPFQDTVQRGKTAKVTASVTRASALRSMVPVEDVIVSLSLYIGRTEVHDVAKTDAKGIAKLSVRIPSSARIGTADVYSIATKSVATTPCAGVSEEGHAERDGFMKIQK